MFGRLQGLCRWPVHHCMNQTGTCSVRSFSEGRYIRRVVPVRELFTSPNIKKPHQPDTSKPPIPFRTRLLVSFVIGGVAVGVWRYLKWEKEEKKKLDRIKRLRNVAVGQGDFNLLDHKGQPCCKKDLQGNWILLYFGFTHCPDICPDELDKLSSAVSLLEEDPALPQVLPVFITVDPERDDVEAVAKYLSDFHPRFKGLTGTPDQVKAVAKAYRVYYSTGPPDEDNDYIVDHTIITYVLNPDGLFTDFYTRNKSDKEIAESVRKHMKTYKSIYS